MTASEQILAVYEHFAQQGKSLATAALAGAQRFEPWNHHPRDDAIDRQHGTRFYYHAHDGTDVAFRGEHGHFHVFARAGRERQPEQGFVHLVGISLDPKGLPLGLFTTNAWVTGESQAPLPRLLQALNQFELQLTGRLAPVARWVNAMVRWQSPAIAQLLRARDAFWRQHPQGLKAAAQDPRVHLTHHHPLDHFWSALIKEST